jgi:hypothetical protein
MDVMAPEVIEEEFNRFAREWDLDADTTNMSEEDRESFETQKKRVTRQIAAGNAVVDEDGNVTYTLQHPPGSITELVFRVPGGDAYMAMDKFKDRQNVHKLNAFMGVMTKTAPSIFSNLDGRDVKFCQAVSALFLGS